MYVLVEFTSVFMCEENKHWNKLWKNHETTAVKCFIRWYLCELAETQTCTASHFVFAARLFVTLAHSLSLTFTHTHTQKCNLQRVHTLAHALTQKMLTPLICCRTVLELSNQQNHLSGISRSLLPPWTQPRLLLLSPSAPPTTPLPPLQSHDGTNIPSEISVITSWPSH